MPTGPQHYQLAESLINSISAASRPDTPDLPHATATQFLAEAQVHATLALAAATAMSGQGISMHDLDYMAWDKVCGVAEDDDVPGGTDG